MLKSILSTYFLEIESRAHCRIPMRSDSGPYAQRRGFAIGDYFGPCGPEAAL